MTSQWNEDYSAMLAEAQTLYADADERKQYIRQWCEDYKIKESQEKAKKILQERRRAWADARASARDAIVYKERPVVRHSAQYRKKNRPRGRRIISFE
jgi:hypothetical protein